MIPNLFSCIQPPSPDPQIPPFFNPVSEVLDNVVISSVIAPVVLLICKNLLEKELNYWLTFAHCLLYRPFDLDRNPKTHDWLMIYNPGNGEWECCSLTFHFGLRKQGNGAFVHHYDKDWNRLFTERIPFGRWRETIKGKIHDISLIEGLEEKLLRMES